MQGRHAREPASRPARAYLGAAEGAAELLGLTGGPDLQLATLGVAIPASFWARIRTSAEKIGWLTFEEVLQ